MELYDPAEVLLVKRMHGKFGGTSWLEKPLEWIAGREIVFRKGRSLIDLNDLYPKDVEACQVIWTCEILK